ncbi:hypothetical protein BDB00DRAFT_871731 [Zychaea mexicana]|uniref:uncharacterized protein n=1 Tax=Zychaea mexicana TaxID=64656 RepID=UPI0022FE11FF|nr:uncharacterized protein BDB00DRAFT_871731 [Zychaea mexicana]KAI9494205.1 hypothetical protein BDB00DRAFT_871731 [Zychaea mexicana]
MPSNLTNLNCLRGILVAIFPFYCLGWVDDTLVPALVVEICFIPVLLSYGHGPRLTPNEDDNAQYPSLTGEALNELSHIGFYFPQSAQLSNDPIWSLVAAVHTD